MEASAIISFPRPATDPAVDAAAASVPDAEAVDQAIAEIDAAIALVSAGAARRVRLDRHPVPRGRGRDRPRPRHRRRHAVRVRARRSVRRRDGDGRPDRVTPEGESAASREVPARAIARAAPSGRSASGRSADPAGRSSARPTSATPGPGPSWPDRPRSSRASPVGPRRDPRPADPVRPAAGERRGGRRSACRRSRPWPSSRATTCPRSPTRPRRSCSPSSRPGPRPSGSSMPISLLIVVDPRDHRRLLPPDDPGLPERRRQLHRRRRRTSAGPRGLVAAAALLDDYVLTVSVSVAAGVAAITSAFPGLARRSCAVELSAAFIVLVMLVNLRGIRESGTIFAIPTYVFLVVDARPDRGRARPGAARRCAPRRPASSPAVVPARDRSASCSLMRAFADGCSAITGVEAVSNGVPAFKPTGGGATPGRP